MQPLRVTIFADGDPSLPALRNRLRRGRFAIALDGAAEAIRKQGWLPHLLAGDFDSVSNATLKYFKRKGVPLLHTPDQNHTDLEKALAWCTLRGAESIWLAQCLGGRVDHSFVNLSLLKRFHDPKRELALFQPVNGGLEKVTFAGNQKLKLSGAKGRLIAVLPFPKCKVSSRGLLYEMQGLGLQMGRKESAANSARTRAVTLAIRGEALVVEGISPSLAP